MFQVRYLITSQAIWDPSIAEDMDYENDGIEGMFELNVNGKTYGFYREDVADPSWGGEWLDFWFESLLLSLKYLQKNGYALIYDLETPDQCIEFKLKKTDILVISHVLKGAERVSSFVRASPLQHYQYGDWSDEKTDFTNFRREVLTKAKHFVQEIFQKNPRYKINRNLESINSLIDEIGHY